MCAFNISYDSSVPIAAAYLAGAGETELRTKMEEYSQRNQLARQQIMENFQLAKQLQAQNAKTDYFKSTMDNINNNNLGELLGSDTPEYEHIKAVVNAYHNNILDAETAHTELAKTLINQRPGTVTDQQKLDAAESVKQKAIILDQSVRQGQDYIKQLEDGYQKNLVNHQNMLSGLQTEYKAASADYQETAKQKETRIKEIDVEMPKVGGHRRLELQNELNDLQNGPSGEIYGHTATEPGFQSFKRPVDIKLEAKREAVESLKTQYDTELKRFNVNKQTYDNDIENRWSTLQAIRSTIYDPSNKDNLDLFKNLQGQLTKIYDHKIIQPAQPAQPAQATQPATQPSDVTQPTQETPASQPDLSSYQTQDGRIIQPTQASQPASQPIPTSKDENLIPPGFPTEKPTMINATSTNSDPAKVAKFDKVKSLINRALATGVPLNKALESIDVSDLSDYDLSKIAVEAGIKNIQIKGK